MKILITGGAGFQGSHLVDYLRQQGHVLTVLNTWSEEAETNTKHWRDKVNIVWGSVTDKEIVDKTVRGQEVVFHLAGRINVDESIKNPLAHITANILGTYNVLEAVKDNNNRLIHVSSCEAYGGANEPISETAELKPQSPYAATKAAADRLGYSYYKTYGIRITIIRPFNVFGQRQKAKAGGAVIPIFVSRALAGQPLLVFGSGEQTRDYTYISDLIRGYGLVLEHPETNGEVINFGTGREVSIKSIAEYIAKKLGVQVKQEAARPGEVSKFICDYGKAKKLLGWEPAVSIWQGIDKYIEWRKGIK